MDLVDEQQRAFARGAPAARRFERFLQIGDAGEHGADLLELEPRLFRKQSRDRRLARAGRAPQDHGGKPPLRHHAADGPVRFQQVILSDDLLELFRPQTLGQGRGRALVQTGCLE